MTFFNPILNILDIIVLIYTLNYTFVEGLLNVFADADANTAIAVFRLRTLRFGATVENSKCSAIFSFNKDICAYQRPHSLIKTGKLPLKYDFKILFTFSFISFACAICPDFIWLGFIWLCMPM